MSEHFPRSDCGDSQSQVALQTGLSKPDFLRYGSETPEPTQNSVFEKMQPRRIKRNRWNGIFLAHDLPKRDTRFCPDRHGKKKPTTFLGPDTRPYRLSAGSVPNEIRTFP